jgi:hypothetical protein
VREGGSIEAMAEREGSSLLTLHNITSPWQATPKLPTSGLMTSAFVDAERAALPFSDEQLRDIKRERAAKHSPQASDSSITERIDRVFELWTFKPVEESLIVPRKSLQSSIEHRSWSSLIRWTHGTLKKRWTRLDVGNRNISESIIEESYLGDQLAVLKFAEILQHFQFQRCLFAIISRNIIGRSKNKWWTSFVLQVSCGFLRNENCAD